MARRNGKSAYTVTGQRKSMVLRDIKPKRLDKVAKAIQGKGGLTRDLQPYSEHFYANPNEPIMILDKEAGTVNHAHQDTWNGVKTFTHYRVRKQRRP